MICDHGWITSIEVKHWGGIYVEFRCAICGTGLEWYKVKSK
jgi:hypothetical protein